MKETDTIPFSQFIKKVTHSMRLRTLPLSLSGVLLGSALAYKDSTAGAATVVYLLLTTMSLQILSNLSNELGDFLHGTDNERREGPTYSLAQGGISVPTFRKLIASATLACCLFGTLLVWSSFGTLLTPKAIALLLTGLGAIWAALHYTLGEKPYGHRGLGDLFVFIFFGLVSVLGSYFVLAHRIGSWTLVLPAASIGFFSVGVLNVNNIRDMRSDTGIRATIPIRIGERNARIYHSVLISAGWACLLIFTALDYRSGWNLVYLLTIPLFAKHLAGVWTQSGEQLDKYLPMLVISTFLFALLAGLPYIIA